MRVHHSGKRIYGRVFYNDDSLRGPGWILQYFDAGELRSVVLGIEVQDAVLAAVADAADYLSCRPEHIQVGEAGWVLPPAPKRQVAPRQEREVLRDNCESCARIVFAEDEAFERGWYVQYQKDGKLNRQLLWQSDPRDIEAARTEAAWLMGCHPDEITVGGDILKWTDEIDPRS